MKDETVFFTIEIFLLCTYNCQTSLLDPVCENYRVIYTKVSFGKRNHVIALKKNILSGFMVFFAEVTKILEFISYFS